MERVNVTLGGVRYEIDVHLRRGDYNIPITVEELKNRVFIRGLHNEVLAIVDDTWMSLEAFLYALHSGSIATVSADVTAHMQTFVSEMSSVLLPYVSPVAPHLSVFIHGLPNDVLCVTGNDVAVILESQIGRASVDVITSTSNDVSVTAESAIYPESIGVALGARDGVFSSLGMSVGADGFAVVAGCSDGVAVHLMRLRTLEELAQDDGGNDLAWDAWLDMSLYDVSFLIYAPGQ
jgi:hypothetical protein